MTELIGEIVLLIGTLYILVWAYKWFSEFERLLKKILEVVTPLPASRVVFYALIEGKFERVEQMNLKVTEEKTFKVEYKDAKQNVALVDGKGKWSLTNPSLAELTPSEDGLTCKVVPSGPLGECELQLLADADMGEGVKEILGTLPLTFIAGEAVEVVISEA